MTNLTRYPTEYISLRQKENGEIEIRYGDAYGKVLCNTSPITLTEKPIYIWMERGNTAPSTDFHVCDA